MEQQAVLSPLHTFEAQIQATQASQAALSQAATHLERGIASTSACLA